MTETFTDSLRRRLLEASKFCPTCGQPTTEGGMRALGRKIGVAPMTVSRFLSGRDVQSDTIDAIVKYLGGPV